MPRTNLGLYCCRFNGYVPFHFVENIGMNLRMFPVTGIPLPFISYGGTYMIVCYIAIGIIVSISMRRQRPMFEA